MTQMAQICLMAFYIFCENLCESVVKPKTATVLHVISGFPRLLTLKTVGTVAGPGRAIGHKKRRQELLTAFCVRKGL
jgi:hypothetical protein